MNLIRQLNMVYPESLKICKGFFGPLRELYYLLVKCYYSESEYVNRAGSYYVVNVVICIDVLFS